MRRRLYFGDNLEILRREVASESVDLIYLDPPFNSNKTHNLLFVEDSGRRAESQVEAFGDTWEWSEVAQDHYETVRDGTNPHVGRLMEAFYHYLGQSDLMAYLCMMAPRLLELHRVLKTSGTLFLHCDQTASHYLKLLLDAIFGKGSFRNDIIWSYRRWPAKSRAFQRMHDDILFYVKDHGSAQAWNQLYEPLSLGTIKTHGTSKQRAVFVGGRRVDSEDTEEESPGTPMTDVWPISIINPRARERTGYPTQKPEALLERIIRACSNEGDLVLDPFCGCGTTVAVASRLGRHWIGIDLTYQAIKIIENRLLKQGAVLAPFEVFGVPKDLESAKDLARRNPYQFEEWALDLVGAKRLLGKKKGADRGIDGYLTLPSGGLGSKAIVQVKSGNVGSMHIRELVGVVQREAAHMGVFVTLKRPTKKMEQEAIAAGLIHLASGVAYPRIKILTVEELLANPRPPLTPLAGATASKKKRTARG